MHNVASKCKHSREIHVSYHGVSCNAIQLVCELPNIIIYVYISIALIFKFITVAIMVQKASSVEPKLGNAHLWIVVLLK